MKSGVTGNKIVRTNTFLTGSQSEAEITRLKDGGYVITWQSAGQDSDGTGVYQQRYNANGKAVGSETHVSVSTTGIQENASVTALSDGGWIVSWAGDGTADGTGQGSGYGVYQRRYDANGNPTANDEDLVNVTVAGYQYMSDNVGLADGGWLTVWSGQGNGDSEGIFMSRFNASGIETLTEIRVNGTIARAQANPNVAVLKDGGWIVTWQSRSAVDNIFDVYQQRYSSDGAQVGSETLVNTWTANFQQNATVAGLNDGGWVVAWSSSEQDADAEDIDAPGTSDSNIYLQRYDVDGNRVKGETLVNNYQNGTQAGANVAALADGGYLVSWWGEGPGSGGGVYFQHYGENGKKVGGQELVSAAGGGVSPDVIALPKGGWIITWNGYNFDNSTYEVYHRRYAPDIAGKKSSENLNGTAWGERLLGLDGKDKLDGKAGNDILDGGKANDTLKGGGGVDTFVFATGYGKDTVSDFVEKGGKHEFVDLSGLKSVKDWKDLDRHHLEQHGKDVWIDGGKGDVLVLENVRIKDLDEGHFLF